MSLYIAPLACDINMLFNLQLLVTAMRSLAQTVCKVLTQAHSCSIQHSKHNNGYQKLTRKSDRSAELQQKGSLKRAGADYSSDAMQEV